MAAEEAAAGFEAVYVLLMAAEGVANAHDAGFEVV